MVAVFWEPIRHLLHDEQAESEDDLVERCQTFSEVAVNIVGR